METRKEILITMVIDFDTKRNCDHHDYANYLMDCINEDGNEVVSFSYGEPMHTAILPSDERGKEPEERKWIGTD